MIALNLFAWAVLCITQADAGEHFTVVRLCISAMHAVAGWLFMRRMPANAQGTAGQIIVCLPTVVISGIVFSQTSPPSQWPTYATLMFFAGTLFSLHAMLSLGRSFAVLPALRTIRTNHCYALIRHPLYAGELVLVLACVLASPTCITAMLLLSGVALTVVRIGVEESVLERDFHYRSYQAKVRWRLVPGVW